MKNIVYKCLDNYNYLLLPTTLAAVGYKVAGPYGALTAFSAGMVETALLSSRIISHRYLSATILGASAFTNPHHKITAESAAFSAAGGLVGLSIPTGIIKDYPIALTIFENAFFGYQLAAGPGVAAGMIATAIDEGLNYYNVTSKSHFSSALKVAVASKYTLPHGTKFLNYIGSTSYIKRVGHG